jgi:hypothetical protein
MLSDDEWARVARDIVHRTGLAPRGQDDDAVRWIAVRYAPDHMHIVAMLARQDGTRLSSWNDYYRVGEACRAAEERFGLRRTAPRDRTGAPRPTRAESEKARRQGRPEPPRITLRRAVSTAAAAAASEHEFFARLDAAGISVRRRYSTRGLYTNLGPDARGTGQGPPGPLGELAADRVAIRPHSPVPLLNELLTSRRRQRADTGSVNGTVRHLATQTIPGRHGEVDLPNSSQATRRPHP